MIDELFAVPEIMFTHVNLQEKSHFQYWQRNAMAGRNVNSFHLYVEMALTAPSVSWLSGINIQLISMKSGLFLSLCSISQRWWLVQSFHSSWTFYNEHDRQYFQTQFAIAEWIEQDAQRQARPVKSTGLEVHQCII